MDVPLRPPEGEAGAVTIEYDGAVAVITGGASGIGRSVALARAGRGADVVIDAVGTEAERSFMEKVKAVWNAEKGTMKVIDWCTQAVRRGGIV